MPDSVCSQYLQGKVVTTASTDAGVANTINARGFRYGTILIKNTGDANTIQYKIDSHYIPDGTLSNADVAYTDIAPAATATFTVNNYFREDYVITVKAKVGGSQSNFIIEYCLGY